LVEVPKGEVVCILAHPAGGTRFACSQMEHATGGHVVHERVRPELWDNEDIDFRAAMTYRQWGPALNRYAEVWACVREPIRHVRSCSGLFKVSSKRGMILAKMFGDGLPRGPLWAYMQTLQPIHAAMASVLAFYEKVQRTPRVDALYRVEDIGKRWDGKDGTHKGSAATWDELYELDPGMAETLWRRTVEFGYA
jgi:hypothetical protein